jgi:hypothetical protein
MSFGLTDQSALVALADGIGYTHASAVRGDVAEFGSFWGRSAEVLAAAVARHGRQFSATDSAHGIAQRELWLFDSFQGLPTSTHAADLTSPHVETGVWCWTIELGKGPTPEGMMKLCAAHLEQARIKIVPGWYKDTLGSIPAGKKFALVHADCDLYESTYQVLDHLLEHDMLSDGCALYFDDWYCNRGSPKFGQQKAFADIREKYGLTQPDRLTDWGAYGVLGRRFIVHEA